MKNSFKIGDQTFYRAPLWRRYGAGLLDAVIIFLLLFVPFFNFLLVPCYLLGRDSFSFSKGASLGKLFFRLMVISKAHGNHLSKDVSSSIGRSAFLLLGFDVFTPLFRADKMRIGDVFAYTEVVLRAKIETNSDNKERYVDLVNRYYPIYLEKENEKDS